MRYVLLKDTRCKNKKTGNIVCNEYNRFVAFFDDIGKAMIFKSMERDNIIHEEENTKIGFDRFGNEVIIIEDDCITEITLKIFACELNPEEPGYRLEKIKGGINK